MAHGYSILEMTNMYEKEVKGFKKISEDIMSNKSEYYGILSITNKFDLLIALVPDKERNAVYAIFYRGWIKPLKTEGQMHCHLMTALRMFPEIKTIKFLKDKWPKPYGKEEV